MDLGSQGSPHDYFAGPEAAGAGVSCYPLQDSVLVCAVKGRRKALSSECSEGTAPSCTRPCQRRVARIFEVAATDLSIAGI